MKRLKGFRLRLKAEGVKGFRPKVRGRRSEHFSLDPFILHNERVFTTNEDDIADL
jgi:hypothetical protein